ncbi:hypothetical protein DB35_09335 [Streptomyces abyssalis]|uniref:Uncharacterized protein n=1 Tax=Streptomyces abyssalis TaxID=933944 RepID=A0A1E7JRU0_9ACTN|nr:hypothetical protein AN215_03480 [Streptomyces abyssalis]OEU94251.1 hypothetical protein DB35_09335 [Streptomyces abyssalis]OEV04726.1 hypothetical protein AN219_37190 [Streptomyces nanshensis]
MPGPGGHGQPSGDRAPRGGGAPGRRVEADVGVPGREWNGAELPGPASSAAVGTAARGWCPAAA